MPLSPAERDYAAWLGGVERSVVLPLKWAFVVVCFCHWLWTRHFNLPETDAVAIFVFFVGITAGEHYFFLRDRILPSQVRLFVFGSFVLDAAFAALLIVLDNANATPLANDALVSDYFVFFILLVLRGFALFRTSRENVAGFAVASILFFAAAAHQVASARLLGAPTAIEKLALIWAAMLITQGFIVLVHAQQAEEWRIRERTLRSESLASLGELAAGVAHEINNPIGIIKSYTEYLEKVAEPGDDKVEDYRTIRDEAARCEEIVRRMVDSSNPRSGAFGSVDLETLVRETVQFAFITGEVASDVRVIGTMTRVHGDPLQLKQAFLNVLLNARQMVAESAPPEGGRVTVTLSRLQQVRPPIRVEITDNGPGIAPGDVEKAFEPFFTKRSGGTGLGLAITRRIVEAHGGSIAIAPRPEGGTRITIDLPIETEEQP